VRHAAAILLALLATSAWPADARYRGRFYFGPDVQVFEPCTELKAYWIEGTDKALKPLITRSEQLAEKRGKANLPVYVELLGRIDTKTKREGPAQDYDGLLHVSKVLKSSTTLPKRCRE
jgi:hypothetical protein